MRSLTVLFLVFSSFLSSNSKAETIADDTILVKRTTDFEVTGNGDSHEWKKALWNSIPQRRDTLNKRETKVKTLYSQKGIYFLFNNQDEVLTASKKEDFDSLWLEDVNEVFLWPDTTNTIYFEYEISPFNNELPLLVPHLNGTFIGWRPWTYTKERKTRHMTNIVGDRKTGAKINSWTSEFFIPYELLAPLQNVPARPGAIWRANIYRVDYDYNKTAIWSWKKVENTFHQFEKFGKLVFE